MRRLRLGHARELSRRPREHDRPRRGLQAAVGVVLAALAVGCGGGGEPRMTAAALVETASQGEAASVRRILDAGVDVDARGPRGRTAVTAAAMAEQVDVVRLLVDAGADVNLQDADRNNPLLVCGENG